MYTNDDFNKGDIGMVSRGKIQGQKVFRMKNYHGDLNRVYNGKEYGVVKMVSHEDDGGDFNSV